MARGSHRSKLKQSRKLHGRRVGTRSYRKYFLIICEGERSEPNYFRAMANDLPPGSLRLEVEGTGFNTLSLVNYAIEKRSSLEETVGRSFDQVWVLFDKDDFPASNFDNAVERALKKDIRTAWSNESFELWYLLHFQSLDAAIARSEYLAKLSDHLSSALGKKYKYKKNSTVIYQLLEKSGDVGNAIRRAKKLQSIHKGRPPSQANPCTVVFMLVEEMLKYMRE